MKVREKKDHIYIFTERVKFGSLLYLIQNRLEKNDYFSDEEVSQLMRGIMEAVNYIHNKDIVHRDLKPGFHFFYFEHTLSIFIANILIEDPKKLTSAKLTDFGLSAMVSEYSSRFFTEQCGTPLFMAPELVENKLYSKPVDVWSCGIMMFCVVNKGKHPYNYTNREELIEQISKSEWSFPPCFSR